MSASTMVTHGVAASEEKNSSLSHFAPDARLWDVQFRTFWKIVENHALPPSYACANLILSRFVAASMHVHPSWSICDLQPQTKKMRMNFAHFECIFDVTVKTWRCASILHLFGIAFLQLFAPVFFPRAHKDTANENMNANEKSLCDESSHDLLALKLHFSHFFLSAAVHLACRKINAACIVAPVLINRRISSFLRHEHAP